MWISFRSQIELCFKIFKLSWRCVWSLQCYRWDQFIITIRPCKLLEMIEFSLRWKIYSKFLCIINNVFAFIWIKPIVSLNLPKHYWLFYKPLYLKNAFFFSQIALHASTKFSMEALKKNKKKQSKQILFYSLVNINIAKSYLKKQLVSKSKWKYS